MTKQEFKARCWHESSGLMLKVWKLYYDGSCEIFNREVVENGYCDCSGNYYDVHPKRHIIENGGHLSNKHPIMLCIGLQDKNKKDIHKGDIVAMDSDEETWYGGEVKYDEEEAKYYIDYEGFEDWSGVKDWEIIGNVYENKNLLKEDESK